MICFFGTLAGISVTLLDSLGKLLYLMAVVSALVI
jgi:hypothetical protein